MSKAKKIVQNREYVLEDIQRNFKRLLDKADIAYGHHSQNINAADECGVSVATFERLVGIGRAARNGTASLSTLVTVATYLGVSIAEFFLPVKPESWYPEELDTDINLRSSVRAILECLRKNGSAVINGEVSDVWLYIWDCGMVYDMMINGDRHFALTDFGLKYIFEGKE